MTRSRCYSSPYLHQYLMTRAFLCASRWADFKSGFKSAIYLKTRHSVNNYPFLERLGGKAFCSFILQSTQVYVDRRDLVI